MYINKCDTLIEPRTKDIISIGAKRTFDDKIQEPFVITFSYQTGYKNN